MERSRSGFENVDQASIDLAGGVLEEMIHNSDEAGKGGLVQLLISEGQ
jgi:hypothetical protein